MVKFLLLCSTGCAGNATGITSAAGGTPEVETTDDDQHDLGGATGDSVPTHAETGCEDVRPDHHDEAPACGDFVAAIPEDAGSRCDLDTLKLVESCEAGHDFHTCALVTAATDSTEGVPYSSIPHVPLTCELCFLVSTDLCAQDIGCGEEAAALRCCRDEYCAGMDDPECEREHCDAEHHALAFCPGFDACVSRLNPRTSLCFPSAD